MKDQIKTANKFLLNRYNKIKPSIKEQAFRLTWVNFIRKKVIKIYPNSSIDLFGSFFTDLYVHSSDIDISLKIDTTDQNLVLKNIKHELYKTGLFTFINHLSHAKIPILKFTDKKYGLKFDISVNNNGGILAAQYIKKKIEEDENIKILAILFKHFIYSRKLDDASFGGLNSYSQLLMIMNYLELHPFYSRNDKNISVVFFDFIQYYGFNFKYKNVQIDTASNIYKTNTTNRLSIIDPTDPIIDVGSCCKNMDKVIETLQNFYRLILYHFEKSSIEELFEEVFYFNSRELEKRQYIVDNYKARIILVKKKSKKLASLRDVNLFKNSKS